MTVTPTEGPSTTEEDTLPAIYHHCKTVYDQMFKEAKLVAIPIEDDSEEGSYPTKEILVYEGHLTRLFSKLHLSVPYYTSVTQNLKRMGCIQQLRRGGGNAPSQWQLIKEPTEELFRDSMEPRKVPKGSNAQVQQQIRDLNLRVSVLEDIIRVLVEDRNTKETE